MTHPLDRPIWSALTGKHGAFAKGTPAALRFDREVSPFAAPADQSRESLAALQALVEPDETVVLVQADPIVLPAGLVAVSSARVVQMMATSDRPVAEDARIQPLGTEDEAEIYDLATLTRPGPFARRSMRLGEFWGIRQDGRLIGMAGERLRQDDWHELSAVCVHPDMRGQGLGRLLSGFVTARIRAKDERPYLHAFETNIAAIELYRSLGFEMRATMNVTVARLG
jgi:predicted GNAT family acetyltransferase